MTIIRDKTPSDYQFNCFTQDDLRAKLVEILGASILSKTGENGLNCQDVIFAGKGTFAMTVYKIIGFAPSDVWQKLNLNGSRVDFGQRYADDNLTVICQKISDKGNISKERLFVAVPSQTFADLKKMNVGFRKVGG